VAVSFFVAGLSTAAGVATGTIAFTFSAIATSFLARAAIGIALNALAPKPKTQGANRGYQVTTRGSALDHQIIYGRMRTGGVIVFDETTGNNNKFLHRVIAFAGHEVESFDEIYIDDEVITLGGVDYTISLTKEVVVGGTEGETTEETETVTLLGVTPSNATANEGDSLTASEYQALEDAAKNNAGGPFTNPFEPFISATVLTKEQNTSNEIAGSKYKGKVRINTHLGSPNQQADSDLVNESDGKWTNDHRLRGIAYLYVKLEFDRDVFPNGVPDITATVKGKKVYDPRTNTTAWSDNPALCLRDYITEGYGLNEETTNIDDTLVASAADVCDETNTLDGSTRYTCNGAFVTQVAPVDILNDILTSMGGLLWYAQGQWRMKPAYYVAPTVSFTEDDLRSSISVKTRHSRRDNFNTVKGTFRGEESNWQVTDYPEVSNEAFLLADKNQESVLDLELPFTDNAAEARRIARIALERNRQQLTVSASFGLKAFQVQTGDIINLTVDRFGWESKEFEVTSWTFGLVDEYDLQVQMTLREISESVFDEFDDGVVYERDNTTLPNPFINVAPENLTVSDGGFTTEDGTYVNSFIVDWDAPDDAFVDYYVLEWRVQGDSKLKSVNLDTTEYQIAPILENTTYEIRVKAVNLLGVSGPYASTTTQVGGDTTAPGPVTDLAAVGAFKTITVSYLPPTDADWSLVNIYESSDSNFGNSSLIGSSTTNNFYRLNLPNDTTLYYWAETVDYSGNVGAVTGPVSATTQLIEENDFDQSLQDTLEQAGVQAVNTLPASGDFDNQIVLLLSDFKLYRWDASAGEWSDELYAGIEDGSITETKISNNAISTPKLQTNAITANEISAGAITTNKVASNAVVASKIASGAVTADKISVNELSAVAASIGTFQSALSGERVRIADDVIEVYDSNNQIRVKIGNLA